MKRQTYRANRVGVKECCLWITKSSSRDVKKVVSLFFETVKIPTFVSTLVRSVDGYRLVFFHIFKPTTNVWLHQVSSDEVNEAASHATASSFPSSNTHRKRTNCFALVQLRGFETRWCQTLNAYCMACHLLTSSGVFE